MAPGRPLAQSQHNERAREQTAAHLTHHAPAADVAPKRLLCIILIRTIARRHGCCDYDTLQAAAAPLSTGCGARCGGVQRAAHGAQRSRWRRRRCAVAVDCLAAGEVPACARCSRRAARLRNNSGAQQRRGDATRRSSCSAPVWLLAGAPQVRARSLERAALTVVQPVSCWLVGRLRASDQR